VKSHVIGNDNYKSLALPVTMTLGESNLAESGGFRSSFNFLERDGDTLHVFSYPLNGFNRPISAEYFYFDSLTNDDLDGWYLPGRPGEGKQDDLELFQPGVGFIIRTNRGAEEENRYWTTPLPYNPFAE